MNKHERDPIYTEPINIIRLEKGLKKITREEYLGLLEKVGTARKIIGNFFRKIISIFRFCYNRVFQL
jgi:hypothetical protein